MPLGIDQNNEAINALIAELKTIRLTSNEQSKPYDAIAVMVDCIGVFCEDIAERTGEVSTFEHSEVSASILSVYENSRHVSCDNPNEHMHGSFAIDLGSSV